MHIHFSKIRCQNFLSYGNEFTEILLDKSKSTLIIGINGSGKSTVLTDALTYVLYGRPFRNINKPQLVNSIIGKNMLVECEFRIGKKEYLVRRGQRPNIFEIYINGILLEQSSDIREYQDILEKNILKMSFKSFKQIVILGSADYRPFMQLPTGDRRDIIEDFLDIQIFSIMNSILKEKISSNKFDINTTDHEIHMLEQKIELNEKHAQSLRQNNNELIQKKKILIEQIETSIEELNHQISILSTRSEALIESIADQNKIDSKKHKLIDLEKKIESKIKSLKKEVIFFENHDNCPTCKQDIDAEFKHDRLKQKTTLLNEAQTGLEQLEKEYSKVSVRLDEIQKINKQINQVQNDIQINLNDIRSYTKQISSLKQEIEDIDSNTSQIDINTKEIKSLKKELKTKIDDKYDLIKHREILDISSALLKDGGIKTKIIKQYIPIINKLVNKYLSQMNFFVNFEIDEKFNEVIKSRHRDEFSYASFSEGEKLRINLALLFTWRAIAKLRNSTSTNLLVMDEIFDSSLDDAGTEEFLEILESLTSDTNVFVISHKGQNLYDKFHSVIEIKKEKNFSRIAT